jgi:hypothetical protein
MALVGIAINVESPGQDLLPRPGRVVPLGVSPQSRRAGVDLDVFGPGEMERQAGGIATDLALGSAEQPEGLGLHA